MEKREMNARIECWMGRPPSCGHRYPECLNAMAEAERVVAERGLEREYVHSLHRIVLEDAANVDLFRNDWYLATATAAQRAEALRRVIDATQKEEA